MCIHYNVYFMISISTFSCGLYSIYSLHPTCVLTIIPHHTYICTHTKHMHMHAHAHTHTHTKHIRTHACAHTHTHEHTRSCAHAVHSVRQASPAPSSKGWYGRDRSCSGPTHNLHYSEPSNIPLSRKAGGLMVASPHGQEEQQTSSVCMHVNNMCVCTYVLENIVYICTFTYNA